MIKTFFKYLLSLCLLLISVHSTSYAHSYQENTKLSFTNFLESTCNSSAENFNTKAEFQYKPASSGSEKEYEIKGIDVEVEEYEWISLKKYLENNHSKITALFYTFFSESIIEEVEQKKKYPYHDLQYPHFRPLYIQFCVYRI
ncbi:hypothetical protein [Mesonia maritima]|uniref:Uncharacterized protein n=1 Tax=Mesonia maritima TaxID=1793873 RepID=A0ABU1K7E0_9FLAO|nr:hypothetical protein [Mesonia maritima]MDR6301533.1 hypothetical protein [Mesonia maritima]